MNFCKFNNYFFQQKTTMTTPNYSAGKYGQPFYSLYQGFYNLPTPGAMNVYPSPPFPTFPNQLPYHYVLPQAPFYPPHQNYPYGLTISPGTRPVAERPPVPNSRQTDGSLQLKNQSKEKLAAPQIVDLVSDEEEPIQTEKPVYDKTSASNSRLNEYNHTELQTVVVNQNSKEKKQETANSSTSKPIRLKQHNKVHKKVEYSKHKLLKKKSKTCTESSISHLNSKGKIHSKRISEKQTTKKEPFRLPKRQREMLQIGYLRELQTGLLTGPHFQAKIPQFNKQHRNGQDWLNTIRQNLLLRRYEEEPESEDE